MISQAELIPYQLLDDPIEIQCRIERSGSALSLAYFLWGESLPAIPSPLKNPQFTDELWKDTCFEAFLQIPKERSYLEMNFAPSGHYAFYVFEKYRQGMRSERSLPKPEIQITWKSPEWMTIEVKTEIPEPWASAPMLKIAVTAVLNHPSSGISHWSVKHRIDKPDFHDPVGFVLSLKSQ